MKPKDILNRLTTRLAAQLTRAAYRLNRNGTKGQIKRLIGAQEYLMAQREAVNAARGLFALPSKADDAKTKETLIREISGQLKSIIRNCGPITKIQIGKAATQIAGELHAHQFKLSSCLSSSSCRLLPPHRVN